jgi:hypothetical protein
MICYNLRRLTAILDPKELKNRLKRPCLEIFGISGQISGILSHFPFPANSYNHKRNGHETFARAF